MRLSDIVSITIHEPLVRFPMYTAIGNPREGYQLARVDDWYPTDAEYTVIADVRTREALEAVMRLLADPAHVSIYET